MKKLIIMLIIVIALTGCNNSNEQVDDSIDVVYQEYQRYIEAIDTQTSFQSNSDDFTVRVVVNDTTDGALRYDIILDEPTKELHNIQAVVLLNDGKEESFTTIGILEETTFSLIPGVVDKTNNIYKGINLSAILNNPATDIKMYITYTYSDSSEVIERYIDLHDET